MFKRFCNWIFGISTVKMNRNGTALESLNMICKSAEDLKCYKIKRLPVSSEHFNEYHKVMSRLHHLVAKGLVKTYFTKEEIKYVPTQVGLKTYQYYQD